MSNNTTSIDTRRSATAIAQVDGQFKAVQIRSQGGAFELLWTKSSKGSDITWSAFGSECGLSIGPAEQTKADGDSTVVVGLGSAGVAFYHLELPAAKEQELAAMIRLQAETLLPLPIEKMEIAWRGKPTTDSKVAVTIAAARREYLQQLVQNVRSLEPAEILLDCEAIVRVWKELFYGDEKDAVIVSLAERSTQVCLAEDRQLNDAVVLDTGIEDLLQTADSPLDSAYEEEPEQTEIMERFVQDIKGALESFGYTELIELPVLVLSDGSRAIEAIVSSLKSAGLNARTALPEIEKIKLQEGFGLRQLHEYRVPIGLALMTLDRPGQGLNLFQNLYEPAGKEEKTSTLQSPKIAAMVASAMLALFVIVSYATDVVSPIAIQKRLKPADSSVDIDLLMQRQKLIRAVALERPNLLELLKQVTESADRGIKLDGFHFRKGQLVSITGQAQSSDQLYKFQEALLSKNGIKDVNIQSASMDSRSKKLKFTITFHYKNFTQRKVRGLSVSGLLQA